MRILLDSCIAGQAAEVVRQAGHDLTWGGDWPSDPESELAAGAILTAEPWRVRVRPGSTPP